MINDRLNEVGNAVHCSESACMPSSSCDCPMSDDQFRGSPARGEKWLLNPPPWSLCCSTCDRTVGGGRTVGVPYDGAGLFPDIWPQNVSPMDGSALGCFCHPYGPLDGFPVVWYHPTEHSLRCRGKSSQTVVCLCRISGGTVVVEAPVCLLDHDPCCGSMLSLPRSGRPRILKQLMKGMAKWIQNMLVMHN